MLSWPNFKNYDQYNVQSVARTEPASMNVYLLTLDSNNYYHLCYSDKSFLGVGDVVYVQFETSAELLQNIAGSLT